MKFQPPSLDFMKSCRLHTRATCEATSAAGSRDLTDRCAYTAFALLRFGVEAPPPELPSASRFFFLSPGAGLSGGPGGEPCSSKAQRGRQVAQQVNGQRQLERLRPLSSTVKHL